MVANPLMCLDDGEHLQALIYMPSYAQLGGCPHVFIRENKPGFFSQLCNCMCLLACGVREAPQVTAPACLRRKGFIERLIDVFCALRLELRVYLKCNIFLFEERSCYG